jgi:lipopolysaccharide exporter
LTTKQSSVAASALKGVRWNYAGSIFSIVCSMTIGAVLARILGPGPFGQAIVATTIYGFVNLFVNGGFSQALIQAKELPTLTIRRTFTTQMALGLLMTTLVIVLAPFLARQFHTPSAVPVIRAMAWIITIQSFGLVSSALLRRGMRFKAVQYAGISGYLVGYVLVGLPMAMKGFGVWSLVAAYLVQALVNSILCYAAVRHTVLLSFHPPDRKTSSFGGAVVASSLVNWGHSNLDNLASSRLGPFSLGLYGRASNLAYQPVTAVVGTVQSVLMSATAKVQDRPELLRRVVLSMLAIVFGLIGPAYVTLACIPDTVIVGLYGTKWIASVPLMVPMALAMPFWGGMSMLGPVLSGLGKPQLEFWPQAISCAVAAVAFYTASHYSILAIAWALCGVSIIRLIAIAAFTFRQLAISWSTALTVIAKRLLLSAVFGLGIAAADHLLRMTALGTGARLAADAGLATVLMLTLMWTAAHLLFGRLAVAFLLDYAPHLPGRYVQQLRLRVPLQLNAAVDPVPLV